MTEMSVITTAYAVERRGWLLSPHGTDPGTTPSGTLDVSAFTQSTHYPDGAIRSGIIVGLITATKKLAPYLSTASDGSQTPYGILFSTTKVPNLLDLTIDTGCAVLVHGFVDAARLPIQAAGAGYLDAAARTALKLIHFTN